VAGRCTQRRPECVHKMPPTACFACQLAGGIAGAAGVLAGQPLDTVRIRMQQPECPWGSAGAALRATVAREGPAALFRGVTYPLATISFQVSFQINTVIKSHT
jgi:Mitochondrial carrier protein